MISGIVVGIVEDNVDPDGMNRVLVSFPVDSEEKLESSWARLMSPMAGKMRGMVMLPDIGTEVVLAFAYRTMSPYVIGAVYNGAEDKPEPYHNDDGNNDKRVFWSRNDHMVIFDDTEGAEKVQVGAQAGSRLDVTSAPIYQTLDSAEKVITMFCEKNTIVEAVETISVKCKDFKLEADMSIEMTGGTTAAFQSGTATTVDSKTDQTYKATTMTNINTGATNPCGTPLPMPAHKHPPTS